MLSFKENLKSCKLGLFLSLLTLLFGFGLGVSFGAFEDDMKKSLEEKAESVYHSAYKGDEKKLEKVTKKSWVYMKRAHLHANGLGTSSLALIILLSMIASCPIKKRIISLSLGLGSLGYSLFWMYAGLKAPLLGSTGAAKESLAWLALPSSGLLVLGLVATTLVLVAYGCSSKSKTQN